MAGLTAASARFPAPSNRSWRNTARTEPAGIRWLVTALALAILIIFIVLPLILVFAQAFSRGWVFYLKSLGDSEALSAIQLTLLIAVISVTLNLVFGLIAAWAVAKFEFRGKTLLISLIDLPFAVSPVVAGLIFVLLFGAQGLFGP